MLYLDQRYAINNDRRRTGNEVGIARLARDSSGDTWAMSPETAEKLGWALIAASREFGMYDAEISPLMAQVIAICKRAGISCLCTFDISTEENDGCMCTTCLPDENGVFPEKIKEAEDVIYRKPEFFAFTITTVSVSAAKEK